jgi:hypothetical protein
MCDIPLDLERRFERRWAARFSSPAKERRLKAQQRHQRVTAPEESKTHRRGTQVRDREPAPDSLTALLSSLGSQLF